jgi:hypothetical protein
MHTDCLVLCTKNCDLQWQWAYPELTSTLYWKVLGSLEKWLTRAQSRVCLPGAVGPGSEGLTVKAGDRVGPRRPSMHEASKLASRPQQWCTQAVSCPGFLDPANKLYSAATGTGRPTDGGAHPPGTHTCLMPSFLSVLHQKRHEPHNGPAPGQMGLTSPDKHLQNLYRQWGVHKVRL